VPPQYVPMVPTLVREPFHRPGWIYEEKVDGWRILAHKDGGRVRLLSRTGIDHARRFPDVAAAIARLPARTLVIDGDLAVFDTDLRLRFELLGRADPDAVVTPPVLIAFDVLRLGRKDLRPWPLRDRRKLLEDLVEGGELVLPVRRLPAYGAEAWAMVLARRYEGLVAKDEMSPYRGGVTRSWLKVKRPGWSEGRGPWRRTAS
jgi:bifunctional non-homologous end joining protein LigD